MTHRHILLMSLLMLIVGLTTPVKALEISALSWMERSDWVNVKTDVSPAAVGDGVADDTAAIQSALNMLSATSSGLRTVYFPMGTYRITGTLIVSNRTGISLIGCGSRTRIVWDGAAGGVMFWSDGITRGRFIGLSWDGQNNAAIAIDHNSTTIYESRIRHENEAFIGLTSAAIRDGNDGVPRTDGKSRVPTAEVMVWNCLFKNCFRGIALTEYNDYDFLIEGCQFTNCDTGVSAPRGKCWVHHCRFDGSTTVDILLGVTGGDSVRRCISVGSQRFLQLGYGAGSNPTPVENCVVDGWLATNGAIFSQDRGPLCVTDTVFLNPPIDAPPIKLNQWSGVTQRLIESNNSTTTTALYDLGGNGNVLSLPVNGRMRMLSDSNHYFLNSTPYVDPTVLDAKVDFGAKGNNSTDDTAAIQALINAARTLGNGTIAYIPPGEYKISSTLDISGCDFVIQGSGYLSSLVWYGSLSGTMATVGHVQGVRLDAFTFNAPTGSTPAFRHIVQTDPGNLLRSNITYDGIYLKKTGYTLQYGDRGGGLELLDLGSGCTVNIGHFDGRIIANGSSQATVYGRYLIDGELVVKGTSPKTGQLGFKVVVNSNNLIDIIINDNQDLVVSDYYVEQTGDHLLATRGNGNSPGHITIQGAKIASTVSTALATIDNYQGRIIFGPHQVVYHDLQRIVSHTGTNPLDFGFLGCIFVDFEPTFNVDSGFRKIMAQNILQTDTQKIDIANVLPSGSLDTLSAALQDIADLGRLSMQMQFYGGAAAAWNFEGNAVDHAGGHDGVLVGGPVQVYGAVGAGYDFDGIDDWVTTTWDPASFNAMTCAAWIYPYSANYQTIIGDGLSLDRIFRVNSSGGVELCLDGYTNGTDAIMDAGNGKVGLNQWSHVAASWDPNDGFTAYINGEVVKTASTTKSSVSWQDIALGVRRPDAPQHPANAVLDEVQIYPRVLAPSEVKNLAGSLRGAIAYWSLNGNALDSSSGHDATAVGPVAGSGYLGEGYDFDGVDDYMSTTLIPSFNALTFSAWIYPESTQHHTIVGDQVNINYQFRVSYTNSIELALGGWTNGQNAIRDAGNGKVIQNAWNHIAVTWSATDGFAAYINGELVKTATTTLTNANWYSNMILGVRRPSSPIDFLNGKLDEVRIYSRCLQASEIRLLSQ